MRKRFVAVSVIRLILFLTLSSLSPLATAKAKQTCRSVLQVFQSQNHCYVKGFCSENIFNLLKELRKKSNKVDLSDSEVLIIYAGTHVPAATDPRGFLTDNRMYYWPLGTQFTPLRSRHNPPSTWNYHVLLRHKRQIYDFDHSDDPTALPLAFYFHEMYGASFSDTRPQIYTETLQKFGPQFFAEKDLILYVKTIPALDYLANYRSINLPNPRSRKRTPLDWLDPEKAPFGRTLESYLREHLHLRFH